MSDSTWVQANAPEPVEVSSPNVFYELKNVSKIFKKSSVPVRALDGITTIINRGEQVSIQGPTGGGKSTLLQMLGALDRSTEGSVSLDGVNLGTASDSELSRIRASKIGFVFQTYNLIPTLNALENVETALAPLSISNSERKSRASSALESVGLGDRLTHLPLELSGGQQQRVAIARALVKNPDVLLADEPTGNLDDSMRDEIIDLMVSTSEDRGITLVLVTHDFTVAKRMNRHLIITKGRLSE